MKIQVAITDFFKVYLPFMFKITFSFPQIYVIAAEKETTTENTI